MQNPIGEADLEWILHRNCEGTEQLLIVFEKMKYITEEAVIKTAKRINPEMNVIIKDLQWLEVYNETGYDLTTQPQIADTIYTGTETRNPDVPI